MILPFIQTLKAASNGKGAFGKWHVAARQALDLLRMNDMPLNDSINAALFTMDKYGAPREQLIEMADRTIEQVRKATQRLEGRTDTPADAYVLARTLEGTDAPLTATEASIMGATTPARWFAVHNGHAFRLLDGEPPHDSTPRIDWSGEGDEASAGTYIEVVEANIHDGLFSATISPVINDHELIDIIIDDMFTCIDDAETATLLVHSGWHDMSQQTEVRIAERLANGMDINEDANGDIRPTIDEAIEMVPDHWTPEAATTFISIITGRIEEAIEDANDWERCGGSIESYFGTPRR